MAKPIAPAKGIASAFPDVCKTQVGPAQVPLPYPNVAQLSQANSVTNASGKEVLVGPGGDYVLLLDAQVDSSIGDEAGSIGGVKSGGVKGQCRLVQASQSVIYGPQEKGIVRFLDRTEQNDGNAQGMVLSAFPRVLVGD
jgi:Toxin PAAR-like domain